MSSEGSLFHSVRLTSGFLQKFDEMLLPQTGNGVAAVATGLVAQGNDDGPPVWDAFDFAFEDSELGRVD